MDTVLSSDLSGLNPDYECSFAHQVHPKMDEVRLEVQEYFARKWPWPSQEAKDGFLGSDTEGLMAFLIPGAVDNLMLTTSFWSTFQFLVDDMLENGTVQSHQSFKMLSLTKGEGTPNADNPIELVTHEITSRCRTAGDQTAQRLFLYANNIYIQWAKLVLKSRGNDQVHRHKDLDEYIEYRKKNGGGFLLWPIVRWACVIDLPPAILEHPEIKLLEDITTTHGCLVNDLYSFQKEVLYTQKMKEAGVEHVSPNSVFAAMQMNGLGVHEAMTLIKGRLPALEHDFNGVEQRIKSLTVWEEHRETVDRYTRALKLCIAGNSMWSAICKRYNACRVPL